MTTELTSSTIKELIKQCYLEDFSTELTIEYFKKQFNCEVSEDLITSYFDEFFENETTYN